MEKDRKGLEYNVLRFVAKLDTTRPIDVDRRFIVYYYLSDDTISIYEPPMRNSGRVQCYRAVDQPGHSQYSGTSK